MSVDAAAADRLPWLSDEPAPQRVRPRGGSLLPWAVAALAVVAAGGFWVGTRSVHEASPAAQRHSASTTVLLPPPRPAAPDQIRITPQPEIRPVPVPEVHPAPVREIPFATPPEHRVGRPVVKPEAVGEPASATPAQNPPQHIVSPTSVAPPARPFVMPKPWNPRFSSGAAGRLVQIGAFGSVHQAKRGWWFLLGDYPAMAHLPAVVRETRNSKGRAFYRFDVGTTSQAHSEILCQRMRRITFSCAVVGLPWKAKVER